MEFFGPGGASEHSGIGDSSGNVTDGLIINAMLEGADTGFGGNFSAANFSDGDAGSRISSGGTINMRVAMDNLFVSIGNRLSESAKAKNDYNEIKRLLILYNSSYFNSKIAPFIKEDIEKITLDRFNRVLQILGNEIYNPQSVEIVRQLDVSGCTTDELLETDLDTFVKRIVTEYQNVVKDMTESSDLLNNKILAFESVRTNVDSFANMATNSATDEVYRGLVRYLKIFYEENDLESSFRTFIKAYRRFLIYKNFLGIVAATEPEYRTPLCSVCIDGPVSHAVVPCGHTFCTECSRRHGAVCFICRTQIQQKMRIFFN